MVRKARRLIVILVALSLVGPGLGWAQNQASDVVRLLNTGFDLPE